MTVSSAARPFVRAINTLFAVALAAFVLANYWPIVKVFDLSRADLQVQGEWIGGHAKRITAVAPGGVTDRAGLKAGDVLAFDPGRGSNWVLASYRHMPEGFSAALPVLAIPIVNQHALAAVVLYGSHATHTLLDPDEIELLHALAKAAATSHSQVRIAMLQRENAALSSENQAQQKVIGQFDASLRALVQERATTT